MNPSDWNDLTHNAQVIIFLLLLFVTVKELFKNGKEIFDDNLTVSDRQVLKSMTACMLVPLAVLLHECGHMLAIYWAGGAVKELQYGVYWGFVIPIGTFTPFQDLVIDAAGSAMDLLIALIALIVALVARSPAIVALGVYTSMYQIFSSFLGYPLASGTGIFKSSTGSNGDWLNMYTSPLREYVAVIVLVQICVLALFFWFSNGSKPRLWYNCKTRPKWCKEYRAALKRAQEEPNEVNYLTLAWSYYLVDLGKYCRAALDKVAQINPRYLNRWMLEGYVLQNKGEDREAVKCFDRIIDSDDADSMLKARALMAVGHVRLQQALKELYTSGQDTSKPLSKKLGGPALEAYDQACDADPKLGDPLYYKATVLNKLGRHNEAESVLKLSQGRQFLDPALCELVAEELKVAKSAIKETEE